MAASGNRECLLRLHGFHTITLIALAIVVLHVACFVDETESARESNGVKSSKSSKEKEKCRVLQDDKQGYYVRCGNYGEKEKTKNRKGTSSPGENKKCSDECRGKRGARGPRGKTGSKGQRGSRGPGGPPGEDGRDGLNGVPGPKGEIGPIGRPGLQGPAGVPGDNGPKGEQGPRGLSGSQGPPGLPGNCAKPSNATTPTFFCLPGEQGLKGAKGETGKRGAQGPPGPPGSRGSRGRQGSEGPPGAKGDAGPPGDFAGLVCLPRYTSWVDRNDWLSEHPEVHCDRREFLQGFSLEENKARGQRRYKYTCCALRLTDAPSRR